MAQVETKETPELNPRITDVVLQIKNSDLLHKLSQKFDKLKVVAEKNTELHKQQNWFDRYNQAKRAQVDNGDSHIIDVQPDFRFVNAYCIYSAVTAFPSLDVKAHPEVSIFSLVAYELIMFSVHLLIQDCVTRPIKSVFAQAYINDHERQDYFTTLQESHVTETLALLIEHFATVYDPLRNECVYVPSLAGSLFLHDYGRMLPPSIYIHMHNVLATVRTTVPINEMFRILDNSIICQFENNVYTVSNFIAGFFALNQQELVNHNWVNKMIHDFFSPACGRAHVNRPTFSLIRVQPQNFGMNEPNPYDLMFNYSPENFYDMNKFVARVSSFIENSPCLNSIPIHAVIQKVGGITTMTHTVETFSRPTWHRLPSASSQTYTDKTKLIEMTNSEYFQKLNILQDRPEFEGTNPKDSKGLLLKHPLYDPAAQYEGEDSPYMMLDETPIVQTYPDVLLFQPYHRDLNIATMAMTIGIKIENNEVDAAIIPTPNIADPLIKTNSNYLTGSVQEHFIDPVIPMENRRIEIIARQRHQDQINGLAIRDASRVAVPLFPNEELNLNNGRLNLYGITLEEQHNDPTYAFTYAAWNQNETPNLPPRLLKMWSSYRHVKNSNRLQNREVSMYYSFRPMYGTSVPLSRVPNPVINLP